MEGGMAGSHLRWDVYEDMVNLVWPQASEQERRNIFLIMRRDLGSYWRPGGWNGHAHMRDVGEGPWRNDISDKTPWMRFRQVLARFNPDNQYAVTMRVENSEQYDGCLRLMPSGCIIRKPSIAHLRSGEHWESNTARIVIRAYRWEDEYRINWIRRCAEDSICKVEKLDIPDDGTM